jgi:hypothetical protein
MAATTLDGPIWAYGDDAVIQAAIFGSAVPDPNSDAGPSGEYQGGAFIDVRYLFPKDQIIGKLGAVQAHLQTPYMRSISQIPAALGAAKIAAAQAPTTGTALTLAGASVGITQNVPILPFTAVLNGGTAITAALALDFGFAFGNCTAGSTTIPVANSALFPIGMPVVIGGVGNSGGTAPLLTFVTGQPTSTSITVNNAPLATNATAPIGTGNQWSSNSPVVPAAAYPFFAKGPGLFLDPRQALSRNVSITGVASGVGGTMTVHGWDIYGQPMSETITVGAGAVTGYGKKAFKYIGSVVPNFTDTHNYSVGTGDTFGFAYRTETWEQTDVCWAGASMTATAGWTTADQTNPATSTTGDVRGTIQTGAAGAGTGIGSTASNGTVSGLAMAGNRLEMAQHLNQASVLQATPANPASVYGSTQA